MSNDPPISVSRRVEWFATTAALLVPTLITYVYFVLLADFPAGVQQTAYSVGKGLQFAFPLVWVIGIQRRKVQWLPKSRDGLVDGVVFGLLALVAMSLLYQAWLKPGGYFVAPAAAVRQKVAGMGIDSLPKYIAMGTFYALIHSLLEEYYWRWFVFAELRRLCTLRTAVVVSSVGFMAHHILVLAAFFGLWSIITLFFSLSIAVGGAAWAWLYHKSGSLYGPWVGHLIVDAAIFAIGYDLVRDLLA